MAGGQSPINNPRNNKQTKQHLSKLPHHHPVMEENLRPLNLSSKKNLQNNRHLFNNLNLLDTIESHQQFSNNWKKQLYHLLQQLQPRIQ